MATPVDRQGLEDRQRHVAGAGRHIDEHEVHVLPQHVRPELGDGPGDDRAAPDDGLGLFLQDQVHAHHLHAAAAGHGQQVLVRAVGVLGDAEGRGDGGTGDVRVQHGAVVAPALHLGGQQARHQGLAHAALAGDHGDHLADIAALVGRFKKALRRSAGRAVLSAA